MVQLKTGSSQHSGSRDKMVKNSRSSSTTQQIWVQHVSKIKWDKIKIKPRKLTLSLVQAVSDFTSFSTNIFLFQNQIQSIILYFIHKQIHVQFDISISSSANLSTPLFSYIYLKLSFIPAIQRLNHKSYVAFIHLLVIILLWSKKLTLASSIFFCIANPHGVQWGCYSSGILPHSTMLM